MLHDLAIDYLEVATVLQISKEHREIGLPVRMDNFLCKLQILECHVY